MSESALPMSEPDGPCRDHERPAWSLDFARALGEPLCGGVIRQEPADFFVTEDLGFPLDGEGEHAWLLIRKTGNNTGWVASRMAEFCGIRPFDVGYAGRKDRHAVAEQWFSCYLPGRPDPDWTAIETGGVEVLRATRHGRKLRRGNHRGNRFRIRIRHLDRPAEVEARLAFVRDTGFPNYFGEQRFGRAGHNLECAERLFAGERVPRAWRGLYISAARAWLFNRVVSDCVRDGTWCEPREDGRGRTAPLFGKVRKSGTDVAKPPAGFEGWCQGLERLGVKAARRRMCMKPEALKWHFEDDRTLVLSFGLPSGSFATSLLREVVRYREARGGEEEEAE